MHKIRFMFPNLQNPDVYIWEVPDPAKHAACIRRYCTLRVWSAYRTVSDDASLVIAGLCSMDLLAIETRDIRNLITEGTKQHRARPCADEIQSSFGNFAGVRQKKADGHIILYQTLSNGFIESTGRSTFIWRKYWQDMVALDHICTDLKGRIVLLYTFCKNNIIEVAEHVSFVCPRFETYHSMLSSSTGWGLLYW